MKQKKLSRLDKQAQRYFKKAYPKTQHQFSALIEKDFKAGVKWALAELARMYKAKHGYLALESAHYDLKKRIKKKT